MYLVTQISFSTMPGVPSKGIFDCAVSIAQKEGIKAFYRGLAARLIILDPMSLQGDEIGFDKQDASKSPLKRARSDKFHSEDQYGTEEAVEDTARRWQPVDHTSTSMHPR